jgi:diguanylate cyclase (GGDEF)-like protein
VRFELLSTATAVAVVSPLLTTIAGWWKLVVAMPLVVWNRLNREQLRQQADLGREPISGLLNRQGLAAGVQSLTATDLIEPEDPRPFGVVLVNVESVLQINKSLGRNVYEDVVSIASRRLADAYGEDRVGRLSGEGFVILVPDLTEEDALAEAESAVRVLESGLESHDIPFALDPAGGVALSPRQGREFATLLMKAELAMRDARANGRTVMLYARQAAEEAAHRVTLLRELHTVLRDPERAGEITTLFQPQVDLETGRLAAVEALLRWNHPQWGPIPTDVLIDAIEPSGIMHLLTRRVLEMVAAQARQWNEQGEPRRVSMNVSVQDLHDPNFVDDLAGIVHDAGIDPRQLTIEITERMLIADLARVTQTANALSRLGVGLSLDDFGTGHASLQQLRLLPLTEVKIDRSYVTRMVDNPADRAIVTSVHRLAQALHVEVVAEGVEDERTSRALADLGGVVAQGWYFGRPMTAQSLERWRYEG